MNILRPIYMSTVISLLITATAKSEPLEWKDLFNGKDLTGWVDVNTDPETWYVEDGLLKCKGTPKGFMRSEKQYENFILEIEWRHMEAGGNSGVFLWSEGTPFADKKFPKGLETQMLELSYSKMHNRHPGFVSGELFGVYGLTVIPDNPRVIPDSPHGLRSMSVEFRCKPKGEWNNYVVVAVDGVVKLSINGKFVNGIRNASVKRGYLCLQSEGAEIHFRNMRIMELPRGVTTPEQTAPLVE